MNQTIPVVDLRDFTSGDARRREAFVSSVGDALVDVGFFSLVNHGVAPELVERAYAVAEEFFLLEEATKRRYEDLSINCQRGFTSFGKEHAKDHAAPDLKEFWHVGRERWTTPVRAQGAVKNLWPEETPAYRTTMLELFTQLDRCSDLLLEACAIYLAEPQQLFTKMAEDGDTILRVIHYPPIPEDAHPASVRAAAHEDINLITLLPEATAAGLELLQRDGKWRAIHSLEGQIIVDAGDMLQQLTNGLFKSTTHRVVNPDNSRDRRFSMPFFVHPRAEVDLTPLPSSLPRTGGSARYPRITAGAYLEQRLREIGLAPAKQA